MNDTTSNARHAISVVLGGSPPNGVRPEECGAYAETVAAIYTAHDQGGTSAAVRAFDVMARANKAVAALMAGTQPAEESKRSSACPALPEPARAVERHAAPCAQWLDDYIAFALKAAPMGPRSFHETAGLFAVALAVARRLVLPTSIGDIHPNIYAIWMGEPAIYSKTSALRALTRLVHDAGLDHLLLPEKLTPEALMLQYSLSIPPTLDNWQPEAKEQWLRERAYAAQRGWLMDEAARLFASLKQDHNAGLLGLLLQLYDCPDQKSEETTGRGRVIVSNTYMSFFGVATPHGMAEHFTNRALWENGLWSRFALMVPDSVPPWQFLGEHVPIPPHVSRRYRGIFEMFPARAASLIEDDQARKKHVQVTGQALPHMARLADGVREAWEAYTKAVRYDMLLVGNIDKALWGSYGRFGTHAIKVAMLLAVMDSPTPGVTVELRHWVRAQRIVETWRAGLHRIWSDGLETDEARDTDRLLARIAAGGAAGILPRDAYRPLGIRAADANQMIDELERSGQIEKVPSFAKNGRAVTYIRIVPPAREGEVSSVNSV